MGELVNEEEKRLAAALEALHLAAVAVEEAAGALVDAAKAPKASPPPQAVGPRRVPPQGPCESRGRS